MRPGTVWLALAAVSPVSAVAQDNRAAALIAVVDSAARDRVSRGIYAGLAVGIIDGPDRATAYYGRADLTRDAAPDGHTLFEIGSVTKTFTGLLLALMVNDGRVSLDTPVGSLLPADVVSPSVAAADLRSLAVHRSGLPRLAIGADGNYLDAIATGTAADFYRALRDVDAAAGRGKKLYSNAGMELLGHVLERRAGGSYPELVRARIFEPLGLAATRIFVGDDRRDVAEPYYFDRNRSGRLEPVGRFFYNRFSAASGGVVSTLPDMLTWVAAWLHPEATPPAIRRAIELASHHYAGDPDDGNGNALAWGRNHWSRLPGATLFDHDGLTIGHTTFVLWSPERDRGVVLLTNTGIYGDTFRDFRRLGYAILSR